MKKDIHLLDEKFLYQNPDGDPDFNADHNRAVIAETIKKTEAAYRAKKHEQDDAIAERAAAAATYLKSIQAGGKTSNLNDFFGKREMARLRGEEVLARIKDELKVFGKDGKQVIRRPS